MYCYDLKECNIKKRMVEEWSNYPKGKRSTSINHFSNKNSNNTNDSHLDKHVNYIIEIEHDYLNKFELKCENLLESIEFIEEIKC